MNRRNLGFDEMPAVVADLVEQVRVLNEKVSTICTVEKAAALQPRKPGKRNVITTEEVSKIIHKTRGTIYRMVGRGELPGYKSGKYLVFFEDEIMDWLIQSKRLTAEEMLQTISKGGHPTAGFL